MSNAATETNPIFDFQLDEFYLDLQEDGRNISILSQAEIAQMPFPGLRPFKTSEFQLFKGRGGQAEELVKRLKRNRFLSVIGSSGTGKSSLVRAGLIPQLFGGSLYEAGSKWNIAICRPGKNPITNLAIALSSVKGESKNKELLHENFDTIEPLLNSSIYGLLEVNEMLEQGKDKTEHSNLLIIVDQFEELFRYDRKDLGRENIENHFVDLLLKAASNPSNPVYVIITMRSEFLGDCVKYRGLPEAINEGQYLVPGLNRTQVKEVIEGPIHAAGKAISPGLTELLINEIEEAKVKENLDQLPILQHALMRTYQEAMRQGATEITYEHYSRIGGMQKALAIHAKEKFDELSDGKQSGDALSKKQQIAKIIFQALTDASTDLKGGRRPTELKNIYGIAASISATKEEVDNVVDKFRDSDTSFIMPPVNTALHDDLIMDISHESLMRNWDLLKKWIEEEVRYGRFYQRLHERREEDGQFIQGTLLAELVNWRDCYSHNAVWASRYHNLPKGQNNAALNEELYAKNLFFLQRSEGAAVEARDAEKKRFAEEARQQREEDLRQQKERSRKRITWLLTAGLLVALCLVFWAFRERGNANKESERAKANYRDAEAQRRRAVDLNDSLQKKTRTAEEATDLAIQKTLQLSELNAKLDLQQAELKTRNKELAEQTNRANSLAAYANRKRMELDEKRIELEKHLAEGHLHSQDFYTSKSTTVQEKEEIIPLLFKEPLKELDEQNYEVYWRDSLLRAVNSAVKGREKLLDSPVIGLRISQEVWRRNRTEPVMQMLMNGVMAKNVFPVTKIDFSRVEVLTSQPAVYSTSPKGRRFGFATDDQIVAGRFENGKPEIERLLNPKFPLYSDSGKLLKNHIFATAVAGDTVTALANESRVLRWSAGQQPSIIKLPAVAGIDAAFFSTDARRLVTVWKDLTVNVYIIKEDKFKSLVPDTVTGLTGLRGFKSAVFSPDNSRLLLSYDNGFALYNTSDKKLIGKQQSRYRDAAVTNLSNDGNLVLMTSPSDGNFIKIFDSAAKPLMEVQLFGSSNDENFSNASVTGLSLSSDRKKLLVNQGGEVYVYERESTENITNRLQLTRALVYRNTDTLRSRRLFSFQEKVTDFQFLDSITVVALTGEGNAFLWKLQSSAASIDSTFAGLGSLTDATFQERRQAGMVNYKRALASNEKSLLREAASCGYADALLQMDQNKQTAELMIDTAQLLYQRLAKLDSGLLRYGAFTRLYTLHGAVRDYAKNKYPADTTMQINALHQKLKVGKQMLDLRPDYTWIQNQLATDYWTLSWLLLFRPEYPRVLAIRCADSSMVLNPVNIGVYTNVALAHLLNGDYPKAEAIYKKYKDATFANSNGGDRTFKEAFDQDFSDLKTAGIIKKTDEVLQKEIAHIRKDILGLK